ncbi:MAG TPA: hypothetical protein VKQ52_18505, partial [Puia sp.]|nr:hypothetical protein [Puia sp.]
MLTFLFFNWVGYWLFISWFESRETARWEVRLDNDQYDAGQLTLFKVSAAEIPYSNASARFERADGELEVGNIHYRYVRKRLYNDSLEFLCIPDGEAGHLRQAKSAIIHLVTGLPGDNEHGKSLPTGKVSPDQLKAFYEDHPAFFICHFPARREKEFSGQSPTPCPGYAREDRQPPRQPARPGLIRP